MSDEMVLILDFGSQYTQLIARRVRERGVYCEIVPFNVSLTRITRTSPVGVILSGGPASVYGNSAPRIETDLFDMELPVLGICYGMQLMSFLLGGEVLPSSVREYGKAELWIDAPGALFAGLGPGGDHKVWMSHGDRVERVPPGFVPMAHSPDCPVAAMGDENRRLYGLQFHPEVVHTEIGGQILSNFLFDICGCRGDWSMVSFVDDAVERIRVEAGNGRVVCGLSGGVDSTVTAALVYRALGDELTCIFVDNGLLRAGEPKEVLSLYQDGMLPNMRIVSAQDEFLAGLEGVEDPEKKRKIIGELFVQVFEREAKALGQVEYLAQGTLYPDVIESVSFKGPSATIKSHHNVGGLPERMNLKLIEPLRELFKDEVRQVGKALGLPDTLVYRQPFPGPGLAVRIIGAITAERLEILRNADLIVREEVAKDAAYHDVWQAFAVLLPIKTVGVMGDERTYEHVIALRVVSSHDGMTADWVRLSHDTLVRVANRIINEVRGVNRVVYDISSKPPSTIEWE
jgi:GMP synthase (glutamine-hydrolysing)